MPTPLIIEAAILSGTVSIRIPPVSYQVISGSEWEEPADATQRLGNSDLELSVIGLGTWAIGGGDWSFGWGDQDEQESIECIVRATELGVNWIDTAAVYGFGQSESLVGNALKQIAASQRPLIATKCGRTNRGDSQIGKCLRRESVIAECEASLRRLDIDCIDWVLRRSEVTSAIVGSRNPKQIEQTVIAAARILDQSSIDAIGQALHDRDQRLAALGETEKARV